MQSRRRPWLSILGFPLFFLALLIVAWFFRNELLGMIRDRETARSWVLGWGWAGFIAFILLQVLQVVVFIVPGEVIQVAGGFIFGLWKGLALSLVGIGLGSLVNFLAGRLLGRPFVTALFGAERVAAFEKVAASGKGAAAFFLLFVIPGIPKDILCYVAGLTRLSFPAFLGISLLGRLPGLLGSSYMGAAAQEANYTAAIVVLALASLLFVIGLLYRDRIVAGVGKLLHRGSGDEKKTPGEPGA